MNFKWGREGEEGATETLSMLTETKRNFIVGILLQNM